MSHDRPLSIDRQSHAAGAVGDRPIDGTTDDGVLQLAPDEAETVCLPLLEEIAVISKETVQTGQVRLTTHLEHRQQLIHEALTRQDVVVERVAIGRTVQAAPDMRMEGDVLIYPIVEEILVVEKRLVLKEEIRISRKERVEIVDRELTLRSVLADIQRTPAD